MDGPKRLVCKRLPNVIFCENIGRIFFEHQTGKMKLKKRGVLTHEPIYKDQYFQSQYKKCSLRIPTDKICDLSKNDHV